MGQRHKCDIIVLARCAIFILSTLGSLACKNFNWPGNKEPEKSNTQFQANGALAAPVYQPIQGLYATSQSVTITTSLQSATICYTTNGTVPDCDSTTATCTNGSSYSAPVTINSSVTLKAVACHLNSANSPITNGAFTIDTVATAAASGFTAQPGDGEITLAWTNPADADFQRVRIIRKTGAAPGNSSDGVEIFNGNAISVSDTTLTNGTTYYYAIYAYDLAGNESVSATSSATPVAGLVNAPTMNPAAGVFGAAVMVGLTTSTAATIICYTTNGALPACSATPACTTGSQYSALFSVNTSQTVKAIACKSGPVVSATSSGLFTIDTTPPVISGVSPTTNSLTNSTLVSYTFSEECASASVTWNRVGGAPDIASPHVQALTVGERTIGTHTALTLANNPALTQGTIYNITFACSDAAGNTATAVSANNITYDVQPPAVVSAFRAVAGDTRTTLIWANPADPDFAGVKILRKTGSYPISNTDGTVVYNAAGTSTVDNSLTNATQYYYRAFAYDTAGNFAAGVNASATPVTPCGGGNCRIFVTTATYTGALGGIVGADAKCNADAAKPNASIYKALIADGTTRHACNLANCSGASGIEQSLDWPLWPNKTYTRSDGSTVVGLSSAVALLPATFTNSIATGGSQNWTGLNTDWTTSVDHCTLWTDPASGIAGARGVQNSTTSTAWFNGSNSCNAPRSIYCFEQ